MKILLFGGSGDIGFNVVKHLSPLKQIDRFMIADDNIKLSQEKIKNAKLTRKIDLMSINLVEEKGKLPRIMEKADLVINCVGPFSNYGLPLVKAALEAEVNFMDICDEYHVTKEIFSIGSIAKEKGILLLTGMGWSPGITNLAVKKISRDLNQINRLQISLCTNSASIKSLGMILHLLYCRREKPLFFRGQTLVEPRDPHEEKGLIEFLPPFGKVLVSNLIHPELYTLPQYLTGIQEIYVRGAIIPTWLNNLAHGLVQLPLFKRDKYLEGLASQLYRYQLLFSKRDRPFSTFRIDLWGRKGHQEKYRVFQMIERKGEMVGIAVCTALLMLMGKQRDPSVGLCAPEGCLDADLFFHLLEEQGLEYQQEEY